MQHSPQPLIGFLGLGNMGGPMCRRLVAAGYAVTVFDINETALADLVSVGATRASTAADCAAHADLFLTLLPRPDNVESVMAGPGGALAARAMASSPCLSAVTPPAWCG